MFSLYDIDDLPSDPRNRDINWDSLEVKAVRFGSVHGQSSTL